MVFSGLEVRSCFKWSSADAWSVRVRACVRVCVCEEVGVAWVHVCVCRFGVCVCVYVRLYV